MFNTDHLHPMIVHFPVAIIAAGFLAEVVSLFFKREKCLSKCGFYLLILGTLSAIAAWSTGQLFTTEPTQGAITGIFAKHENGALITMILMLLCSAFRIYLVLKKKEETSMKWIAFALFCLAFLAVTYTGHMGGTMVYDYMMAL